MEGILQLMTQHASGSASHEQLESAVSNVLSNVLGGSPPSPKRANSASNECERLSVDMANYDEDDTGEDDETTGQVAAAQATEEKNQQSQPERAIPSSLPPYPPEALSQIPMGVVGAKMMATFGDGEWPNLDALRAALEGTRRALQCAILDARAIRRRAKESYKKAKAQAAVGSTAGTLDGAVESADPVMVYRAHLTHAQRQHDRLNYTPKCGFDMEQLTWLFPEEMRAYERWSEMHSEYQDNRSTNSSKGFQEDTGAAEETEATDDQTTAADDEDETVVGGHLKERAANFDVRTLQMPQGAYAKFSECRRGSFLSRKSGRQMKKADKEWEQLALTGGSRNGSWNHMSAISVRFLHWLGFEPPTFPPPDEETTEALGFLGYDRMGQIVEQAIYLRNISNLQKQRKNGKSSNTVVDLSSPSLRELKPGEQLTVTDIERAIRELDIKPAAHYKFDLENRSLDLPNVQLYFGPGFERRLEMELDE